MIEAEGKGLRSPSTFDGTGSTMSQEDSPTDKADEAKPHPNSRPIEDRFWEKVEVGDPDECWGWAAGTDGDGYGMIGDRGRTRRAHRVMMALLHGPLEKGDLVLHHCDNPPCVNPLHLYIGTYADNFRDMIARSSRTLSDYRGSKNGQAKLTEDDVREIRRRLAADEPQRSIAEDYGVDQATISNINRGVHWTHVEEDA